MALLITKLAVSPQHLPTFDLEVLTSSWEVAEAVDSSMPSIPLPPVLTTVHNSYQATDISIILLIQASVPSALYTPFVNVYVTQLNPISRKVCVTTATIKIQNCPTTTTKEILQCSPFICSWLWK